MEMATEVPLPHSHQSVTSPPAAFEGDLQVTRVWAGVHLFPGTNQLLDLMEEQGQLAWTVARSRLPKEPPLPAGTTWSGKLVQLF